MTAPAPVLADTNIGEHDRFRHYYRKIDLERAYLAGAAIRALCGKVDVPLRDPDKYPTCPTCAEIYERMQP